MIIDVFSKYGWAVPLKNKSGPEVSQALRQILQKINVKNYGSIRAENSTTTCINY